ncbi:MAG: hypothetical protein HOE19_00460 [Candidatus Komeilibacteria bacterium]|jgi:hypothetical protein|nr:hypothetical protein [Candidatus Komeilibacteria bacterium]MBT4447396.1 hypothetical protein [Candidatus Komeilibacteria bacterium]
MPKTKNKYKAIHTIITFLLMYIIGALFITSVFVWTEVRTQQIVSNIFATAKSKYFNRKVTKPIDGFKKCVAVGRPILESHPRRCVGLAGQIFVEDSEEIVVDNTVIRIGQPLAGTFITSPLIIQGEAVGTWFFEGDFAVTLIDEQQEEVAVTIATAQGEWMTEDFVDFEAELIFEQPDTNIGFLVFKKDNPSGLTEYDDAITIPVFFK